ncbi:MAG: hypothetical protein ABW076_13530 [Candidatus Thiodiazotropha sp.]
MQTPSPEAEVDAYWAWLRQSADRLERIMSADPHEEVSRELLTTACDQSQPVNYREQAYLAEADVSRKDLGLFFDAGIRDNWDSDSDTLDENQRAYVGLSWQVLDNGYREKRHLARLAEARAEREALRSKTSLSETLERCRYDATRDSFAPRWIPLLNLKEAFLTRISSLQRQSYWMGTLYLDDLLDSQRELQATREHFRRLQRDSGQPPQSGVAGMPLLPDIDMVSVRARILEDPDRDRLLNLEQTILDAQREASDDTRLRLYLRYEVQEDSRDNGPALGATFSMPLLSSERAQVAHEYLSKDALQSHELGLQQRLQRAELAYAELLEQRERVVRQSYRYLAAHEQLRRSLGRYVWRPESADFKAAVSRMASLLDGSVELLRALEEMYRRVHTVFARAGIGYRPELVSLSALQGSDYRARDGARALYIWSAGFNSMRNPLILEFLRAKGVSRVIVSGSERVVAEKLERFIERCRERGVSVEILTGDNGWLDPARQPEVLQRLERLAGLTGSLNIDVEPHTLADYKTRRREYLERYLGLLRAIREKLGAGVSLSVSVPLHWDAQDYAQIGRLADHVYLMAYEIADPAALKRRLGKVLPSLDPRKVVIALRPQDFQDEPRLERVIGQLVSELGVQRYALHDLATYVNLADSP